MLPEVKDIRLRVHGNLARLEVSPESIPAVAAQAKELGRVLKQIGFDYVTLDLEGYRSGCFDGHLQQN